ncbi:MAG: PCI domain-containing protein [Candidatus Hodarchaeota archaeon]
MSSESEKPTKKLVIISVGIELPQLLIEFLNANLKTTIILNTTADFFLSDRQPKNKEKSEGIWYHHEIVKLANAIVPDDMSKSSLTKIFSQPIAQTRIPLSDSEKFLVQWVSERQKANQSFYEFFKALNEYAGNFIEVYPLKFPEETITIKTKASQVPLRYFQITGFIDRDAEQKTDLEELQNLLVEDQEDKGKKKAKKPIEIIGLDFGRDILTEEAKKEITEADAILWIAGDPCSLALLLLHKEFTKTIKESKAQATLVCPSRFSFREHFILQLLGVKPTLLGIAELGSGIVDKLVVGPEEASEITDLRSKGFNVIMEDITKIKNEKGLSSILKSMGISLKDVSMKMEDIDKKGTLEDLVTQLSYTRTEEPLSEEKPDDISTPIEVEDELKASAVDESPPKEAAVKAVKLQDTEVMNYDFQDPSLKLTQEMVESLMMELSPEVPPEDQQSTIVIDDEAINSSKIDLEKEESTQFESQEAFTEAVQTFLKSERLEANRELIQGIGDAIAKNADMASYAAKKLTSALETHADYFQLIPIYLEFLRPRSLIFIRELIDWLFEDISSPDFVTFVQKALIIVKMSKHEPQFSEQLIKEMIDFQISKALPPIEREHIRTLCGMIVARDVTLQRHAIRAYLSHYEKSKKLDDVWLGLLKFDAALVALEIIEHQTKIGVQIVQDVLSRNLGSYGHIIYDVFNAYQKGDIQRVLTIAGPLSDSLTRKRKRIELAERIKKFGSIPIEVLARSIEMEPSELESLVYEMINESEINAKIEVVEGRLTIVQLNNQVGSKEGDDK